MIMDASDHMRSERSGFSCDRAKLGWRIYNVINRVLRDWLGARDLPIFEGTNDCDAKRVYERRWLYANPWIVISLHGLMIHTIDVLIINAPLDLFLFSSSFHSTRIIGQLGLCDFWEWSIGWIKWEKLCEQLYDARRRISIKICA